MSARPIIQIAYADDHKIVRRGITEFINNMDGSFKVYIEADNGEELLDKIANASYQPDICILDIAMPVMDGFETMLQLKKEYPLVHGLAFTALDYGTEYPVLKMMKNGAGGYITKNASPDELEKALIDIYATGFCFSKAILEKFPKMNEKNIQEYLEELFTEKETKFLSLCCSDMTYMQIGEKMCIGNRTAENYAAKLCNQLNLHSRAELAMYALCAGIGHFRNMTAIY